MQSFGYGFFDKILRQPVPPLDSILNPDLIPVTKPTIDLESSFY